MFCCRRTPYFFRCLSAALQCVPTNGSSAVAPTHVKSGLVLHAARLARNAL